MLSEEGYGKEFLEETGNKMRRKKIQGCQKTHWKEI